MSVTAYFDGSVGARPGQVALVDGEVRLTWADLDALTGQARAWLALEGLEPGDRLVYAGAPDHRMVVWFWAALRHGAVFVPLHDELNAQQLRFAAANCQARVLIANCVDLDLPATRRFTPGQAWDGLRNCLDAPRPAPHESSPDEVALLIYTSGTTGRPRGVICPHRQVRAAVEAIGGCLGYRADDVILCRLPLAFDYGLYQLLLAARVGCAVVLAAPGADLDLVKTIARHGVSVVPLVPSLAQMLTLLQRRRPTATSVRLFTNTGARLMPGVMAELLEQFPQAHYASMYGMTECKRISILPVDEYAAHSESVGYAIPGDQVRIEDADGRALPPGAIGEIVVRGATVMAGYWGIAMHQQSRFRSGPEGLELRTGDNGLLDEDGRLYFVGRDDDIIKRHGIRMSLHEIEDAADGCAGVDASVALRPAIEDAPLTLAYVGTAAEGVLIAHLAASLDRIRRPNRVRRIAAIPLTRNGKPDRPALATLLTTASHPEEIPHDAARV